MHGRWIVLAVALAAALPATAYASDPPSCTPLQSGDVRAGHTIDLLYECSGVESIEPLEPATVGTVSGIRLGGDDLLRAHYEAPSDADGATSFTVRLMGPGGDETFRAELAIRGLTHNEAPWCLPRDAAQRSEGTAPVTVELDLVCLDPDGDSMTITGTGPGQFLDGPTTIGWQTNFDYRRPRYRTAAAAGAERITIRATDELGASSEPTSMSVEVGPGIDRVPECVVPNLGPDNTVLLRPGATREFGIMCSDPDFDPLEIRVKAPPAHGRIGRFDVSTTGLPSPDVQVTYVPTSPASGPDSFTFEATEPSGRRTPFVVRFEPTAENAPMYGCGYGGNVTWVDQPASFWFQCDDLEGDRVDVAVRVPPAHGDAGTPFRTPAGWGSQVLEVPYTPDPGYIGEDRMWLRFTDARGAAYDQKVNITVEDWVPPPPFDSPVPAVDQPPGTAPPTAAVPARAVRPLDQARAVLGVRDVVLVRRLREARVYKARRGFARRGRRAVLAVTCRLACRVDASPSARRHLVAGPRVAAAVLPPRRAGTRLRMRLAVRPAGGPPSRATVRLRVSP